MHVTNYYRSKRDIVATCIFVLGHNEETILAFPLSTSCVFDYRGIFTKFSKLDIYIYLGKYCFKVGELDCVFPSLPSIMVLIQLNPSYNVGERRREMHEVKEQ